MTTEKLTFYLFLLLMRCCPSTKNKHTQPWFKVTKSSSSNSGNTWKNSQNKRFFSFFKKYLIALVGNKVPQQVYVLHYIFEISRTLKTQQSSFLRERRMGGPQNGVVDSISSFLQLRSRTRRLNVQCI